ncbi:MAG: peptide chain release factor N(5)-glutamine methyltransferase [Clostridiales bacterium]|nr:peptide chain release factor N(5)-glutamine methyltransferase [Clostridiales bacterium]
MVIKDLLEYAKNQLSNIAKDERINEAFILLSFVMKKNKTYLYTHMDELVSTTHIEEYKESLLQRNKLMPIAYITKRAYFMDMVLHVEKGVLIPRGDSEIVIEVLKKLPSHKKVLDLCCGSGALGIAYARKFSNSNVTLIDIDDKCISIASKNVKKYHLENRMIVIKSNLFNNIANEKFNLIISNPPYIESKEINNLMVDVKDYEPRLALDGGDDGLLFYKQIILKSKNHLLKGAHIILEIGYNQKDAVTKLLEQNKFTNISCYKDYQKNDRILLATY